MSEGKKSYKAPNKRIIARASNGRFTHLFADGYFCQKCGEFVAAQYVGPFRERLLPACKCEAFPGREN